MVAGTGTSATEVELEVVKGTKHELTAHARKRKQKTTVTPIRDYILIHSTVHEVSEGGMHLPPGAGRQLGPAYAEVIAVGPGRPSEWNAEIIPMPECKVGDTILYHGGAGTEWVVDGKTCYWILPGDLIGVVG